ncbi:MAG TPA: hypothetical protein VLF91_03915 [Candidatus Saccharimonadales bacterium]|nr:hypothetical protein [Candidatus Saccharimonadales bacterium]
MHAAAAGGGVMVTPASLLISLAPGAPTASQSFTLTNTYSTPIDLQLSVKKAAANIQTVHDVTANLSLDHTDLTLAPSQTATETVTLRDNSQLAPGSQLANIVVTQAVGSGAHVSIGAAMTLTVLTIKQAGAVQKLGQGHLSLNHFSWQLPTAVTASLHNTGNMLAIPHGYVTLQAPNGRIVSRGVINMASMAVSPGSSTQLPAQLTSLRSAHWPGMYTATLSYGLGGNQPATSVTARVLYIAWWHVLILLAAVLALGYVLRGIIVGLLRPGAKLFAGRKTRS